MLTAALAFVAGRRSQPAAECEALALESWEGGELLESAGGLFWSAALVALILAGSPHAGDWLATTRKEGYRKGSVFAMSLVELWSGLHLLGTGELAEAGESLGSRDAPAGAVGVGAHGRLVGARPARLPRSADRRRRRRASGQSVTRRPPGRSPTEPTSGAAPTPSCCSPTARAEEALAVAELMGRTRPPRPAPRLEAVGSR